MTSSQGDSLLMAFPGPRPCRGPSHPVGGIAGLQHTPSPPPAQARLSQSGAEVRERKAIEVPGGTGKQDE